MTILDKIKDIKYGRLSKEEKQVIINDKNRLLAEFYKDCTYTKTNNSKFYTCGGDKWKAPRDNNTNMLYNWCLIGLDDNLGALIDLPNLKFHNDWNWLIPIVEKIESLNLKDYFYQWEDGNNKRNNFQRISVDISENTCWIGIELDLYPPITINKKSSYKQFNTKIEAVWTAVNEFIEWYNLKINEKK